MQLHGKTFFKNRTKHLSNRSARLFPTIAVQYINTVSFGTETTEKTFAHLIPFLRLFIRLQSLSKYTSSLIGSVFLPGMHLTQFFTRYFKFFTVALNAHYYSLG